MGITLATLQHWDHDADLDRANVAAMTRHTAAGIYRALHWNSLRGDSLPAGLDLTTFDLGVNAGPGRGAMLLQEVLGFAADEVDSCIGLETLRAALEADAANVIDGLAERQSAYYRQLESYDDFGRGWLDRTERRRKAALARLQGVESA